MPATIGSTLLAALLSLRNTLDYPLRQFFGWRRPGFRLPRAPGANLAGELFAHLPGDERARAEAAASRLRARYRLDAFAADSSPINFRENLFYLDMLERALERSDVDLPARVTAADIGPSHWFYVQALYALLRGWRCPAGREVALTGFEVDAYRVHSDLYSRFDHALAHVRGLPGVIYLPRGFTVQSARFDLITMLFPFVFENDHLRWGLPGQLFDPGRLLRAAWSSLKPGGVLIVVNQGADEHHAQQAGMAAAGIPLRAAFRQDPLLFSYPLDRYVLVACRES